MKELRKSVSDLLEKILITLFSFSQFLSAIYYIFFSKSFYREFYAVIQGKIQYYKDVKSVKGNEFQLRRNIHRIEKGLIMKDRKTVFGRDYIQDTVEGFKKYIGRTDVKNDPELHWYKNVLVEYFKLVKGDHFIKKLGIQFNEMISFDERISGKIPYLRDLSNPMKINLDDLRNLAVRRRSVRWYQDKKVPREMIDEAIKIAIMAPSACNRLPFEFRIFDDPYMVQKISSIPGGTRGFHHNFKVIIVVVGKLNAYFSERDRHLIYIDSGLAVMGLLYALEVQGLSSCVINWPDIEFSEKTLGRLLNIKNYERVVMLISVGYADLNAMVPYSEKKSLINIRSYNKV
jgi:nitroreductase